MKTKDIWKILVVIMAFILIWITAYVTARNSYVANNLNVRISEMEKSNTRRYEKLSSEVRDLNTGIHYSDFMKARDIISKKWYEPQDWDFYWMWGADGEDVILLYAETIGGEKYMLVDIKNDIVVMNYNVY